MSIEIKVNRPEPMEQEADESPVEMMSELGDLARKSEEPFSGLEQEGNIFVEPDPVHDLSDPSTGTELPRPVGAELEDPTGSSLTKRAKQRMIQLQTVLAQRGQMNV